MSLENLLVLAGCLLLGLLVIGRSIHGRRWRLRVMTLCASLAMIIATAGIGFHGWHGERSRAAELPGSTDAQPKASLHTTRTIPVQGKTGTVDLTYFAGAWRNLNLPERGLTKLRVRTQGESIWVHAWERCHPTDCDWGEAPGSAVTPGNSSDATADVQKVTATFQTSFTETTMTLTPAEENTLEADTQTRFTDNSGRSGYSATYTFRH